ncbi:hypothetical protein ACFV2S_20715 [Streptomyces sp. NPDC059695]|uniref:hypothetical protein n=1 Tax=Streptomyces sp. NPDC059695 TaxID=3346910 RepID=UPI00368443D2
MQNHGGRNERVGDAGITTEDIAHSASPSEAGTRTDTHAESGTAQGDGRTRPVYPGEATADTGAEEQDTRGSGEGLPEGGGAGAARSDADEPLLGADDTAKYRQKWGEIQGRFVDDPQEAVRSADAVVAEVMQTLARSFSAHKQGLEEQWGQGEQVATEDLRLALQHYRSFFNRLLKT